MDKDVEEVIKRINELSGKELGSYIDQLLNENDDKIMKNKEVLLTISNRINGFGFHHRIIREKFHDIGLNMQAELDKLDYEKTVQYLEEHPELIETIDIAVNWWISVIKQPFFANYSNFQIPLEMAPYFQLDYSEKKIEKSNQKNITPEKEKVFRQVLVHEIADAIRKEGSCRLRADTFGFDRLGQALEKANLRVSFPKSINMLVKPTEIELANSSGHFDVVYEASNNSKKK